MKINERIHLSELTPSDKPAIVRHLPEKEIYDRTLRIPYPYTEADAKRHFLKAGQLLDARFFGILSSTAIAAGDAGDGPPERA